MITWVLLSLLTLVVVTLIVIIIYVWVQVNKIKKIAGTNRLAYENRDNIDAINRTLKDASDAYVGLDTRLGQQFTDIQAKINALQTKIDSVDVTPRMSQETQKQLGTLRESIETLSKNLDVVTAKVNAIPVSEPAPAVQEPQVQQQQQQQAPVDISGIEAKLSSLDALVNDLSKTVDGLKTASASSASSASSTTQFELSAKLKKLESMITYIEYELPVALHLDGVHTNRLWVTNGITLGDNSQNNNKSLYYITPNSTFSKRSDLKLGAFYGNVVADTASLNLGHVATDSETGEHIIKKYASFEREYSDDVTNKRPAVCVESQCLTQQNIGDLKALLTTSKSQP